MHGRMPVAGSVAVVGGGLAGLACAFDLQRAGLDVRLFEREPHAGGVVGSLRDQGYLFECGPNTVQASAESFRRWCGELNIADRLIASNEEAKERYLFLRGELRALPMGPLSFLTSDVLSLRSKLRILSEPFRRYRTPEIEPDLDTFLCERLGVEAARTLAGSFVRGVYAAELKELGAASAFPRMFALARDHGSLIRGMLARKKSPQSETLPGPKVKRTALLSFRNGLQELIDRAAERLGDRITTGFEVDSLARDGGGWRLRSAGGVDSRFDRLVLAVPAPATARLLSDSLAGSRALEHLQAIRHAAVTLVHLGFEEGSFGALPSGFGYLVPPSDKPSKETPGVMGTIFSSNLFAGRAPDGGISISSFYRAQDVNGFAEDELVERAAKDIAKALKRDVTPDVKAHAILRWDGVIPRYSVGHVERVQEIEAAVAREAPGIELCGSWSGGVSVDNVIARGREIARRIIEAEGVAAS